MQEHGQEKPELEFAAADRLPIQMQEHGQEKPELEFAIADRLTYPDARARARETGA
jgi:hypothetical protein